MNTLATLLAQENQGSPLGILILIIPFGLLIWLMVVPQRKQKARQQQLVSALAVGDEVMTTGGIIGQITIVEDDLVHLEIDHDVVIRVAKGSIGRSMAEPDPAASAGSRGGLLGGLFGGGGGTAASASKDDAVDVRSTKSGGSGKSGGTGVGTARSGAAKTGSKKK